MILHLEILKILKCNESHIRLCTLQRLIKKALKEVQTLPVEMQ